MRLQLSMLLYLHLLMNQQFAIVKIAAVAIVIVDAVEVVNDVAVFNANAVAVITMLQLRL